MSDTLLSLIMPFFYVRMYSRYLNSNTREGTTKSEVLEWKCTSQNAQYRSVPQFFTAVAGCDKMFVVWRRRENTRIAYGSLRRRQSSALSTIFKLNSVNDRNSLKEQDDRRHRLLRGTCVLSLCLSASLRLHLTLTSAFCLDRPYFLPRDLYT